MLVSRRSNAQFFRKQTLKPGKCPKMAPFWGRGPENRTKIHFFKDIKNISSARSIGPPMEKPTQDVALALHRAVLGSGEDSGKSRLLPQGLVVLGLCATAEIQS